MENPGWTWNEALKFWRLTCRSQYVEIKATVQETEAGQSWVCSLNGEPILWDGTDILASYESSHDAKAAVEDTLRRTLFALCVEAGRVGKLEGLRPE